MRNVKTQSITYCLMIHIYKAKILKDMHGIFLIMVTALETEEGTGVTLLALSVMREREICRKESKIKYLFILIAGGKDIC